ncbi:hypothetical protein GA0115240_101412 [Streptomyces sp. DvalAA-14]|nr:hypothetical protein GA0115240_101412 [Streptomyces sp. DvalAA-14]
MAITLKCLLPNLIHDGGPTAWRDVAVGSTVPGRRRLTGVCRPHPPEGLVEIIPRKHSGKQ